MDDFGLIQRGDRAWLVGARIESVDSDGENDDDHLSGTFKLEIELGNAAMSSGADIAERLRWVAERIEKGNNLESGTIRDTNGNTVGHYETEED